MAYTTDKIALDRIVLHTKNPRVIRDAEFKRLKKSIADDPEILTVNPLVLHSSNNFQLLAGQQRYLALIDLGYEEIPQEWVLFGDNLTDTQREKFVLLDNTHAGDWDFKKLTEDWGIDLIKGWDINIPDFNIDLPELFKTNTTASQEPAPEKPSATGSDYSVFELVMLHTNKLKLLEVLNQVRTENEFEKLEEALMHIIESH